MLKKTCHATSQRERALAEGMRGIASELRLIDSADFVAFIRSGRLDTLASLVSSSTKHFFKPGAVSFGRSADLELSWGTPPIIVLGMEFHFSRVNIYFRLVLEAVQAGVEIDYISFERAATDPDVNTRRLIKAIRDARLVKHTRKHRAQ